MRLPPVDLRARQASCGRRRAPASRASSRTGPGFAPGRRHLGPRRLRQPAADPPPLAGALGALPELVDLDGLEFRFRDAFELAANWKVVCENYLECYHCPVAHPGFSRLVDASPDVYRLAADGLPVEPGRRPRFLDYVFAPAADEAWVRELLELDAQVGREDRALVEAVQEGVATGLIEHGRPLPESERLVARFQGLVLAATGSSGRP